MTENYESWGRVSRGARRAIRLSTGGEPPALDPSQTYLPFGNGRSYGDSCHNDEGVLLDCRGLNQVLSFDAEHGVLRAEAGLLLSDVLALAVPNGWFLTVTPGTQYVTIGGAIANDVHGKNHHRRGTFGRHVRRFELLRSCAGRLICSDSENPDFFRATIGGLGLTGLITWAEIQLLRIEGPEIEQETIRIGSLGEFFGLAHESDARFEYTVSWIDSSAKGARLGRGFFMRGNHASGRHETKSQAGHAASFPFDPPFSLVRRTSARLFNLIYRHKQRRPRENKRVRYEPFFYPLDAVRGWNKIYGRRGFLQHQSAVPRAFAENAVREMLREVANSDCASFLTVLKLFGAGESPGLMSFPRPGATLTLDFPHEGERTLRLLDRLDEITVKAGGAVNPYKDFRMSEGCFKASFPQWEAFSAFIDPRFSSNFWRRVTGASPRAQPARRQM